MMNTDDSMPTTDQISDAACNCQLPCLPKLAGTIIHREKSTFLIQIKRFLAKPWNYHVKPMLKRIDRVSVAHRLASNNSIVKRDIATPRVRLVAGDWVRVRTAEEIRATLNQWNELRGCAFLDNMWQYCGTTQQVLVYMKRFLDERDYKVKKCSGIILLKDVLCKGTPVFGDCDRRCHFFWREEWLEKIIPPDVSYEETTQQLFQKKIETSL